MSTFIIEGGKKLKGEIDVNAGKNAPVALLCASLMIKGKTVFKDMTHVEEVERVLEILESIGVKYNWLDKTTLEIDASNDLDMDSINRQACEKTRVSILLLGALAAREKSYKLYKSGGCKLGSRTVRPHLLALEKLGLEIKSEKCFFKVKTKKLKSTKVIMYESGDTTTENVIMAAVLAEGETMIKFASANYMVQDVCYFLESAGAKIEGIGTTTLKIIGVKELHPIKEYYISPDPVDAMAWISLAITTKSNLTIKNCPLNFLELELEKLRVMGQKFELKNERKSKNGKLDLVDIEIIPSELKALPDKLYGRPFPGLNIDNVPLFVPILTQAQGESYIHDWVYENRALYYEEFNKLGAQVKIVDPHRAYITGPTKLKGAEIECPPAIRPGVAILIGMIAADGKSVLKNAYPVERAYESLVERLQGIGVEIEREE